ncbi:hypothetical protein GCM10009113_26270 [Marinobacter szutsaonensis]
MDISDQVTWRSEKNTILDVVVEGGQAFIQTKEEGTTRIVAAYENLSATASVIVGPPLTNLEIRLPQNEQDQIVDEGALVPLRAIGTFGTTLTEDVTDRVTWRTDNTNLATVSNTPPQSGEVSALNDGAVFVSAAMADLAPEIALTIIAAPNKPRDLELSLSPRFVLAGSETTTITAEVFANERETQVVADQTEVRFSSTEGTVTFRPAIAGTVDGTAETTGMSNTSGTFEITAQVPGTIAVDRKVVTVMSDFSEALGIRGATGNLIFIGDENLGAGSELVAFVTNISDREFNLNSAALYSDSDLLISDVPEETSQDNPTQGVLTEGEEAFAGFSLDSTEPKNSLKIVFSLTDVASGTTFEVEHPFSFN